LLMKMTFYSVARNFLQMTCKHIDDMQTMFKFIPMNTLG